MACYAQVMGAFHTVIGANSKLLAKKGLQKDQRGVAFLENNPSCLMTKQFAPTQLFGGIRVVQNTGVMAPSQDSAERQYVGKVTK